MSPNIAETLGSFFFIIVTLLQVKVELKRWETGFRQLFLSFPSLFSDFISLDRKTDTQTHSCGSYHVLASTTIFNFTVASYNLIVIYLQKLLLQILPVFHSTTAVILEKHIFHILTYYIAMLFYLKVHLRLLQLPALYLKIHWS